MGGLSCFLLSMAQPGIEVRPLRQMSGAYHFNEVFLQDAFISEESLVGQLGDARAILRTMLASERAAIGGGTSARSAQQLLLLARRLGRHEEAIVRQEVSKAYMREKVLDLTQQRIGAGAQVPAGGSVVGSSCIASTLAFAPTPGRGCWARLPSRTCRPTTRPGGKDCSSLLDSVSGAGRTRSSATPLPRGACRSRGDLAREDRGSTSMAPLPGQIRWHRQEVGSLALTPVDGRIYTDINISPVSR